MTVLEKMLLVHLGTFTLVLGRVGSAGNVGSLVWQ